MNVFSGEVYVANVAIAGEWIAGLGKEYSQGRETLDLGGLFLLPGLINGHFHLESSLLTPAEYARLALPHGTTTVVLDPHEIANVLGLPGIQALIDSCKALPMDFFFMAPSCVPATPLETAGAVLSLKDIEKLLGNKRVIGLAEMMNFPGVLRKDPEVLEKIQAARKKGKAIDGHAPLVSGKNLNAYVASGNESDHECTRKEEAEEKLRLGMWLMIRQGSAAKNLKDLLPAVTSHSKHRCLFVIDDLEVRDLIQKGEIDHLLRQAVALGLDPVVAVQMATLNPSERFGLRDRGAIAPGRRADLMAVYDLGEFQVALTIKDGKVVAREGKAYPVFRAPLDQRVFQTVKIKPLDESSFVLHLTGDRAWVIGLLRDQILTQKLCLPLKKDRQGMVVSDPQADVLKIAVLERHRTSGNIGLGLVKGLGLKRGALATSVAHDSHNIVAVGVSDEEMRQAVEEIERLQGGFVVVDQGEVKASLPLPIAGLMSQEKAEDVASQMEKLNQAAREIGVIPENPFLTLSFLALPVIPELKITDQGLVDVSESRIISLEV
ncbi:MAG: adenine deaminase [Deltaproteobacteria bacterium]|nr:adenine deaminase [Deltaproteobacteria bacterium]